MKKVLFCATVDSHIRLFHLPFLQFFSESGYEVHVASSGDENFEFCNKKHKIPFSRSPLSKNNLIALGELKKLFKEEHFEIIHCHTPVASAITRLAAKKTRKNGTRVLYTAHGFHFYKGAPKKNWLIYYTMEKMLAKYTDCLITMNEEDYTCAKKHFKAKKNEFVHGVGVDLEKFKVLSKEEKTVKKTDLGYEQDDFLLIYAAEFSQGKDHKFLIENFANMQAVIPNLKLLFAGEGALLNEIKKMASDYRLIENVVFLGFVKEVEKLIEICDLGISPSMREGLPINILEYMACGLPVVASKIRGHVDLLENEKYGFLYELKNKNGMAEALLKAFECSQSIRNIYYNGLTKYEMNNVIKEYVRIYSIYMSGEIDIK